MSYLIGNEVKAKSIIEILNRPICVKSISFLKTGKHGAAKGVGFGYDIFNNDRVDISIGSTGRIYSPEILKYYYEYIDIDEDNYVTMILNNKIRSDLKINDDLKSKLTDDCKFQLQITKCILENKSIIEEITSIKNI